MDADGSCMGMSEAELPAWAEVEAHAVRHLNAARNEMSDARDWLNSDLSVPPSAADVRARSEVLRIAGEVKRLIDQAKDALHG
jgi:hypothetical protein